MAHSYKNDTTALSIPLLQNTKINVRNGGANLLQPLQHMLQTAKKYNDTFYTLILEQRLREEIPAWYYLDLALVKNVRIHSNRMRCLRENHKVRMIGDMKKTADKIDITLNTQHKSRRNCTCQTCRNQETQRL